MIKTVILASCLALAAPQFVDPKNAKILKEQRFNAGDGRFGAAFAQEDGSVFREETSADGERVGQYSYIDQEGNTITVRYTAGKDGFRILEGAHVPTGANGQGVAPAVQQVQRAPAPAPVPVQPVQQFAPQQFADYDYVDSAPVDPNFNPFINPHDPTHRDFNFNRNGANFAPRGQAAPQFAAAVPACADCAGVNPFINPFDASHRQPAQFQQPAQPAQRAFLPAPAQPAQPAFPQQLQPTQAPRNFFPPGQLKLNRFETGFNFDFSS